MSEQINPGDKVMLVWACCPEGREEIGNIYVVQDVRRVSNFFCQLCDTDFDGVAATVDDEGMIPIIYLKKMPPDGEQIETSEVEEMTPEERQQFVARRAERVRAGMEASKQKPQPIPRADLLRKVYG